MSLVEKGAAINQLLDKWDQEFGSGEASGSPIEIIKDIAKIVEESTIAYMKTDPDPFEDRHPCRARPDCALGHVLKNLFKNDAFTNKLVSHYVTQREDVELQTHACRLFLDTFPGLEASVVFKETEGLVDKLFEAAKSDKEPLRSYAISLLAIAMEVQDISAQYKDQNIQMVPICIQRLNELRAISMRAEGRGINGDIDVKNDDSLDKSYTNNMPSPKIIPASSAKRFNEGIIKSPKLKRRRVSSPCNALSPNEVNSECSNSSWADVEPYMIGSCQMYPLTIEMQQRFILQFLTLVVDYPEAFSLFYQNGALSIIKHYINLEQNQDILMAFEALKCLSNLLCHKKFIIEFLNSGGLELLLKVVRPSIAATGVSICLLYLGYDEDAIEKICLFPRFLLNEMVSYALWLLECSHISSRCNATMFLGLTFSFRVILDLFDAKDGLRKLLNVINLLNLFPDSNSDNESNPQESDNEVLTKKQAMRQVCNALKRYFEAHLVIESENIRRSPLPSSSSQLGLKNSQGNIPSYKAAHYTSDTICQYVENLLELMPLRINWKPVDELLRLDGLKLLILAIGKSFLWSFSGKSESIKSALDVLMICSVVPKFQIALTEQVALDADRSEPALAVILQAAAESEFLGFDSEVKKSALQVIINCVCGPLNRIGDTIARLCTGNVKKRCFRNGEDVIYKLWNCVRDNNGIIVLLNLLTIKTPITDADSIRALACKALCGLARSETVRQIISKLPLFTSGQLQALMKEPILQDKRTEHIKFCKYCLQLIESVTGSPVSTNVDTSPANIAKAEVVAQTKITYNAKELLLLIHQHLLSKGLHQSAAALQREATLPAAITPSVRSHSSIWTSPLTSKSSRSSLPALPSSSSTSLQSFTPSLPATPHSSVPGIQSSSQHSTPSVSTSQLSHVQTPPSSIPIKIHRNSSSRTPSAQKNLNLQKSAQGVYQPSPALKKLNESHLSTVPHSSITLDSIVKEYFRKQHALCKNPVVTCPPFELFTPHRCPEPLNRHNAPLNIALRVQRREISPRFGGMFGTKFDRKFIYSRFRPIRVFRDLEFGHVTTCAFSYSDQFLFLGSSTGEMAVFNLYSGVLNGTYPCSENLITFIEPSRDGKVVLTCSSNWQSSFATLWTFTDFFEQKMQIQETNYCEFSKQTQDKLLGTGMSSAKLYDISTENIIRTFEDNLSNRYLKNRATMNYNDELILNDGVLWDVRVERPLHKFDKLNENVNGVFHPNSWEIISNSEVWDLRNYHLLKTVPALDQCRIKFNKTGDVIFGALFEEEVSEDDDSPFGSSFRTFDATDYSNIATIDVKKNICDLAIDPTDHFIAVVENSKHAQDGLADGACRLFEVGRCKEDDDEDPDEDDDDDGIDDSDEDREDATEDAVDVSLDDSGDSNSGISLLDFDEVPIAHEDSEYETLPESEDGWDG